MCASPKDRGVHQTRYKHLHSINGDLAGEDHHFAEKAEAAENRREALKKLEKRYQQRHPRKKKKLSWWQKLFKVFN